MKEDISFSDLFLPLTIKKVIILLYLIGISVFFFGLLNGFVGDDQLQVERNLIIHSLANFPLYFSGGTFFDGTSQLVGFSYKPLLTLSFAMTYAIGAGSPFPFHLFQILLFITNACLVFLFFKKFFPLSFTFLLAILFLVHPINSESAYYIANTQEVLFFFFGMIAMIILQKFHTKKWHGIASGCLFLSLLSKETGILFVFATIFYIFLFNKKYLRTWSIYVAISVLFYLLLRFWAIGIFSTQVLDSSISHLTLIQRLINIPEIIFFYFKTFFYPYALAMSYQWVYTSVDISHFFFPLLIDTFVIGVFILFGIYLYKKNSKTLSVYIFFSFLLVIGLLLHLQIIPLDQTVSDRWFYFPSMGLLGMIGSMITFWKIEQRKIWPVIIVGIIILCSLRTFIRSFDFQNKITITSHDLQYSKEAFGLENELSSGYLEKGNYNLAKLHAQKSLRLHPTLTGYIDLGVSHMMLKEYKNAKLSFQKALRLGNYHVTYENLASLALVYGDPDEESRFIKNEGLKKYPYDVKLWMYVAILDYNNGKIDQAKKEISKAYELNKSERVASIYDAMMSGQKINTFYTITK